MVLHVAGFVVTKLRQIHKLAFLKQVSLVNTPIKHRANLEIAVAIRYKTYAIKRKDFVPRDGIVAHQSAQVRGYEP